MRNKKKKKEIPEDPTKEEENRHAMARLSLKIGEDLRDFSDTP